MSGVLHELQSKQRGNKLGLSAKLAVCLTEFRKTGKNSGDFERRDIIAHVFGQLMFMLGPLQEVHASSFWAGFGKK